MENTEVQTQVATEVKGLVKVADAVYRGTVNDFINEGIKLNGVKMDAVALSIMGRYKMIPQVGERKPARGRTAAVYEIKMQGGFEL